MPETFKLIFVHFVNFLIIFNFFFSDSTLSCILKSKLLNLEVWVWLYYINTSVYSN